MYVLVDREQMAITHKHAIREVLNDLGWIECCNAGITIPLGNVAHWSREFTPAELRRIYKAATGVELQGYGNALAHVVHQMAVRLPATPCDPDEARAQRLCVMDGDKKTYQYCPGSKTPTCHKDLFTADPITCERSEAEEATAASSRPTYMPPTTAASAPASNPFAPQGTTPRAPAAPSAPRAGGVRDIIFSTADEMWNAAGQPRDLPKILVLRKSIMDVLEAQHSIKRTTSSTALGDWQKRLLLG